MTMILSSSYADEVRLLRGYEGSTKHADSGFGSIYLCRFLTIVKV
jgi:hypothetical protein